MKSDYDGAWKDLLHTHFAECLACYFPLVAEAIDWSHAPVFLDQELKELAITEESTGNRVDVLVEVRLLTGKRQLVHLHMEVQSAYEEGFAARVHGCFQGICRGTGRDVVTLVILADLNAGWKPQSFDYELLGCGLTFHFPVCKILEILPQLQQDDRLPALAGVAQIEALRTSSNPDKRLAARWRLTRRLMEGGHSREEIIKAFRLLSWMMKLPETQTLQFRAQFVKYEEMNATTYMTDIEELWLREGMEKGREEGMEKGMEKGREIGEWIGKIILLEELMGQSPSARELLEKESLATLKKKFKTLDRQYRATLR